MYTGGAVFLVTFEDEEDIDVELTAGTKECLLFNLATVYEAGCGNAGIVKGAEGVRTPEVFAITITCEL